MKICFVISDIKTETCGTTVVILKKAHERGHEVYVMGVGDFVFHRDTDISLRCKKIPPSVKGDKVEDFWEQVQDDALKPKIVHSQEMDILFLRNNPTEETSDRHWAEHSGIAFARMIQQNGVLVLNDAFAMSHAFIEDRKSTRLNSSHVRISYAVFCLKKQNKEGGCIPAVSLQSLQAQSLFFDSAYMLLANYHADARSRSVSPTILLQPASSALLTLAP